MKRFFLLSVFLILLYIFCGAPQGPAPTGAKPASDIAYLPLSESELQRFIKVLPVFLDIVEKEGKDLQFIEEPQDVITAFQALSYMNKEISYLDSRLRAAGMGWDEFCPAFAKTMFAYNAIVLDSLKSAGQMVMKENEAEMKKMEELLKDPNIPEAQKNAIKASLEAFKTSAKTFEQLDTVFVKVPQANKDLVRKYINTLNSILERD